MLTTEKFKDALRANRAGTLRSRKSVFKEYTTTTRQVGAEDDRTIEFCITTDSVDRHGDTVAANGWKLDAYRRNPVVLFAHSYDQLPIGKAVTLNTFSHGLRSAVQFAPGVANPMAEQVYQLCKGGFLNAASVGFIPLEYDEAERDGYYPMDITKQELLEWSIVPVPANGEALRGASAKGIDLAVLREWANKTLKRSARASEPVRNAASGNQEVSWDEYATIMRAVRKAFDDAGMPDLDSMTPMQRAWYANNPRR